jgi:hypothetical protein
MAEAAKAPDDQKPSQEALKRLLHTGLVSATIAACRDGARARSSRAGARRPGGRATCATRVTRFGHFFANRFLTFP